MKFIFGDKDLLIKSKFYKEDKCLDFSISKIRNFLENEDYKRTIFVICENNRIYETTCIEENIKDIYEELEIEPNLRDFELACLSICVKMYFIKDLDKTTIDNYLNEWNKRMSSYNPNINEIKCEFEEIVKSYYKELDSLAFVPDNNFGLLNKQLFNSCDRDIDFARTFILQFNDYLDKLEKNIELDEETNITNFFEEKTYIIFVLGYDLLNTEISNSKEQECDLAFEKCNKIAEDFLGSEYNNENRNLYDCLKDYLKSERYESLNNTNNENSDDYLEV